MYLVLLAFTLLIISFVITTLVKLTLWGRLLSKSSAVRHALLSNLILTPDGTSLSLDRFGRGTVAGRGCQGHISLDGAVEIGGENSICPVVDVTTGNSN